VEERYLGDAGPRLRLLRQCGRALAAPRQHGFRCLPRLLRLLRCGLTRAQAFA
jgi:hypothetical protein